MGNGLAAFAEAPVAKMFHADIRLKEEKKKISGRELVNNDHPQVVEIVEHDFMGTRPRSGNRPYTGRNYLPEEHSDTEWDLSTCVWFCSTNESNYDTDVFQPLIREIETITNSSYGKDEKIDIATRVIADHVRAVAFSIADGQLPSNNGAGYVIRRILRRAIRYGYTFLNKKEPLSINSPMYWQSRWEKHFKISPKSISSRSLIKEEENAFLKTLEQGLNLLDQIHQKQYK
ncbi:MAG: alanine--tRNA ligase-related protein [Flavobacteriaceae bacterium]|nr:alanine--tRNA ligase-related protein [Flavobacteriaceae bacterium]